MVYVILDIYIKHFVYKLSKNNTLVLIPCPHSTPEWQTATEPSRKTETIADSRPIYSIGKRIGIIAIPRLRQRFLELNSFISFLLLSYSEIICFEEQSKSKAITNIALVI